MKTNLLTAITTIPQAQSFLRDLIANGEEFDPLDDPFLIEWNGVPANHWPTADECRQLKKLMQDILRLPEFDPHEFLLIASGHDMND